MSSVPSEDDSRAYFLKVLSTPCSHLKELPPDLVDYTLHQRIDLDKIITKD
jgi:hypothetical protein